MHSTSDKEGHIQLIKALGEKKKPHTLVFNEYHIKLHLNL
jgi:hypothetical protein